MESTSRRRRRRQCSMLSRMRCQTENDEHILDFIHTILFIYYYYYSKRYNHVGIQVPIDTYTDTMFGIFFFCLLIFIYSPKRRYTLRPPHHSTIYMYVEKNKIFSFCTLSLAALVSGCVSSIF